MKTRTLSKANRSTRWRNQQGITLVTTLLLMLLLVGMSLTMVLAVSSESLINSYYGRYRGSFYAADSGVTAARQQVIQTLKAAIPIPFNPATAPIANMTTTATSAQTSLNGVFGAYVNVNSANSWQERFLVKSVTIGTPTTFPAASCSVVGGLVTATCAAPTQSVASPITGYKYAFPYTVTVVGQSQGSEVATVVDSGTILLNASVTAASYQQSFAAWGMFIGNYPLCSGDLVPGTITGPVFTNGSWNFSNSGPYTFTDPVAQSGAQAGWDNGGCTPSATPTNGINPTFTGGFSVSQPSVPLPTDSFNQEQAVLDGIGIASTSPTNAQLNTALKNAAGIAYPTGGASSGVYLPYSVNSSGVKTFTGGGIFVQGDAKVTLQPAASSNTSQVYTIVQSGVTTTVTIDPAAGSAGTTTITTVGGSGAGTQTINGVPQQMSSSGLSMGDATMLFVNGNITGLSGPGQGQAAIQNGTALSIVSSGNNNITVTGDILYKQEPVTMTGTVSTIDQLIPANNTGQVLGIFTAGGNVQLNNSQTNQNLEIDASIATISATGSGGIVNTGAAIRTLTIVGGRIQNTIQNINATTRNVLFDRRFLTGGFAPPWFPSTTVTPGSGVGGSVIATWKGAQWLNQTNYQ
jgi:Tfp pilus assembly protein PilX